MEIPLFTKARVCPLYFENMLMQYTFRTKETTLG